MRVTVARPIHPPTSAPREGASAEDELRVFRAIAAQRGMRPRWRREVPPRLLGALGCSRGSFDDVAVWCDSCSSRISASDPLPGRRDGNGHLDDCYAYIRDYQHPTHNHDLGLSSQWRSCLELGSSQCRHKRPFYARIGIRSVNAPPAKQQ